MCTALDVGAVHGARLELVQLSIKACLNRACLFID